jgi:hypothetical protein
MYKATACSCPTPPPGCYGLFEMPPLPGGVSQFCREWPIQPAGEPIGHCAAKPPQRKIYFLYLLARGQADQPVQPVGPRGQFHRGRNHLAAGQDGVHPGALTDAVAEGNGVELQRDAASGPHSFFHRPDHLAEVDVPGDHLVPGVSNPDQGTALWPPDPAGKIEPSRVRSNQSSSFHPFCSSWASS